MYRFICEAAKQAGRQHTDIIRRKKEGRKMRYLPGKLLRTRGLDAL
jgi:hypothetical protein